MSAPANGGGTHNGLRDFLWLFAELSGPPGGRQVVNEDTLRAVVRAFPAARHRVLLFFDREAPASAGEDEEFARVRFTPCGAEGSSGRFRFYRAFAAALLERRPDCIVVGHRGLAPLPGLARRILGIPYVVWFHVPETERLRRPWQAAGVRNADRLVAVSRHTGRSLTTIDPTAPERTVVLPPTVRNRFRPGSGAAVRQRLGLGREPLLLTVARYSAAARYKGYETVVRALPAVLAERPNTRYALVGQGEDLPRVRALARELGVDHAVIQVGAVPHEEMPAWYNACDLYVMPTTAEGFGIAFIEALACGRPVIAGNRAGDRDPLLDGRLGKLVDPDDLPSLADAILTFITGRAPAELTDPHRLSRECVRRFGRAAFEARLRELFAGLLGSM